ncbi:hypothetical protein ACJ72_06225 [Emergomyces africanus]|uniref:Uncharacterized protein n=1 Tax=Emergomyces africanus TaxID=1955775 RepID=A0A1B7NRQ2_9EURO|nr:hypothetical protein ACJ72_06225 [Emergomyces africanus]
MAITRAKEGLIVIGNPDVLVGVSKDELAGISKLLLAGKRRGRGNGNGNGNVNGNVNRNGDGIGDAANGRGFGDEDDIRLEGYVSRLERGLLYAESAGGDFDDGAYASVDGEDVADATTTTGNGYHWTGSRLGAGKRKGQGRLGKERNVDDDYDAAMWTAGIAAEEVLRGSLDD